MMEWPEGAAQDIFDTIRDYYLSKGRIIKAKDIWGLVNRTMVDVEIQSELMEEGLSEDEAYNLVNSSNNGIFLALYSRRFGRRLKEKEL